MKDKEDLIENYENKTSQILALKDYFNSIVPQGYLVRIRYNSDDNVDLIVYQPEQNSNKRELLFRQWNVDLNEYKEEPQTEHDKKYNGKTNSLIHVKEQLDWNNQTFSELYSKLKMANCIGITSGNPTSIDYGFQGMAVLGYLIFDENLDLEQQEKYSDDCMQLFYKDNVVLEYGSGAIGSLCTPEFDRKK